MNAFFIVCAVAAFATVPSAELQAVVAAAASTLFESTPFILAGAFASRLFPRCGESLAALFACGCARGPGARSLAVATLTVLIFGPFIAFARFAAAFGVARLLRRQNCRRSTSVMSELASLLPCALGAGMAAGALTRWLSLHAAALWGFAAGGVLAFFAPCTLGAVALAGTLRSTSPGAVAAMLIVSGICDLRTFHQPRAKKADHDVFAYAIAASACAVLAGAHGGSLLNPRLTFALWASSLGLGALAWFHRQARCARLRWAPLVMAAGTLCTTGTPGYAITETTLTNAAPGDSLQFRGFLARDGKQEALVRFAITCCRADAQPVAVRLRRSLRERSGQWLDARGTLVADRLGLALDVRGYRRIRAPAEPYIYR